MKALAWLILVSGTVYLLWTWRDQSLALRDVIHRLMRRTEGDE